MPTPERPLPVYVQITNHYRDEILDGSLRPAARLPAIAEIAEQWGVAAGTAARAIAQLQVEGAVYTSPQGTFVSSDEILSRTPGDRIKSARRIRTNGDQVEVTAAEIVTPPNYVADLLGITVGEQVVRREEITWHAGHPKMLGVDWIPVTTREIVGDLTEKRPIPGGAISVITSVEARHVTHGRDHIRGRSSDAREATALRLPIGSPILAGTHVWSDDQGVLLYGEWVMPPDQVISYEYIVGDEAE